MVSRRASFLKELNFSFSQSSPKSKKTDGPTSLEQSHFSTADRTILAELKENLTARDSQFARKNGRKHHPYSAKEVPFPRNYERIVLDQYDVPCLLRRCKFVTDLRRF